MTDMNREELIGLRKQIQKVIEDGRAFPADVLSAQIVLVFEQAHIPTGDDRAAGWSHPDAVYSPEVFMTMHGLLNEAKGSPTHALRLAVSRQVSARRTVQGEPTAVSPRCGNYAPHSAHTYREFQDDWPCPGAAATQEGEEK